MHESENGKLNTVRMRISMDSLGNVLLPIPPKDEQDKIVAFLDWKVSAINKLINLKRKQITTLKERETKRINDLLTKGVDNSCPMQKVDSTWMPLIPAGWKLSRIGSHFTIKKRIAGKEGYKVLSITQQGLKEKDLSTNEGQMAADYSGYQFVYPGDFAMNHMDLITGYIDVSTQLGVTSPDYRVFSLDDYDHCLSDYYLQLFQLCYKRRIFYAYGRGAATKGRWRMPAVNFKNFVIPLPPIEEQRAIIDAIEPIRAQTKASISNLEEQILLLQEIKATLISSVVSGKYDVRNVAIPIYEKIDEEPSPDYEDDGGDEVVEQED